jgi:catechol 2,3-dioxygenase-like lactoylglutathione lyase family enzyme
MLKEPDAMKRFHVHLHVDDLQQSIGFYSKLFAAEPTRTESDYAKWMLQDPPVNFAISTRGGRPGIDHLGIQTDDPAELAEMKARAEAADMALLDEGQTTKSTGSPTRRASRGSTSTRWATCRSSAKLGLLPAAMPPAARPAHRRRVASPWASP